MDFLLFTAVALIFYFLGRYAGRESEIINNTKKAILKKINRVEAGPIPYPTPKEVAYNGSEREKIDKDFERAARESRLI